MPLYIGEGGAYTAPAESDNRDLISRTLPAARFTVAAYLVDSFGVWDDIADVDTHQVESGQGVFQTGYFLADELGNILSSGMTVALNTDEFVVPYTIGDRLDLNGRIFDVLATDPFNDGDWLMLHIEPLA